jgi:uncharacterized repeat protein (TIGR03803 family)
MTNTVRLWILKHLGRLMVIALTLALAAIAPLPANAQTFKTLYSFTGQKDGGFPDGPFALDAQGDLYGVAGFSQNGLGPGTVFKLSQAGKLTVLHSFGGRSDGDGDLPGSGVIRDAAGNLYGTTVGGGKDNWGAVFKVDVSGKEAVLYSFTGGEDGHFPDAGLVRDGAGNLYGTTSGGAVCLECGTVFKVGPTGKQTVIHRFKGPPDASHVLTGNLVLDASGNLYGASYYGGLTSGCADTTWGCGTVFELSPNGKGGWSETVLYKFKGGTDGAYPYSGLVRDASGNFYGTTAGGGNSSCDGLGCGTLFKLDSTGRETVLYRFTGGSDGEIPGEQLALDAHGNLYGTAERAGNSACMDGCGTAFELDTAGKLTVLHAFDGKDGAYPGTLLLDSAGNLYGATFQGGTYNWGTVFEITP